MVALAISLERRVRDLIMLGLGWHMFCKMWCFIYQLPQELAGQWGQGQGTCRQPPALPLATMVPLSSLPLPWVSPALSFLMPGHWQLLWGSLTLVPVSPILWTSARPTHLRLLSSLCWSIYLNVSLILHLPLWGRIKFTEKQKMQSTAKSINTMKPRENQNRDTQFYSLSLPIF